MESIKDKMIKLANGRQMPILGLGTLDVQPRLFSTPIKSIIGYTCIYL